MGIECNQKPLKRLVSAAALFLISRTLKDAYQYSELRPRSCRFESNLRSQTHLKQNAAKLRSQCSLRMSKSLSELRLDKCELTKKQNGKITYLLTEDLERALTMSSVSLNRLTTMHNTV